MTGTELVDGDDLFEERLLAFLTTCDLHCKKGLTVRVVGSSRLVEHPTASTLSA